MTAEAATREPEAQVGAALDALTIETGYAYRWRGRLVDCTSEVREGGTSALLDRLEDDLYRGFYCSGGDLKPVGNTESAPAVRAAFREQLAQANVGSTTWAHGWTVMSLRGDAVCVERNGLQVFAMPDEIALENGRIKPGQSVSVALPADLLGIAPGYYVATGGAGDVGDGGRQAVRVYLHPTADAATALVALLTKRLNRDSIPFRLKVIDDPLAFDRCDAAVLHLPRQMFDNAAPALRALIRRLGASLQSGTPALTKRLAPGVALAEDPDWSGESFGGFRCRIIAAAVLAEGARIEVVRAAFARRGLRLSLPYLNAGSRDDYRL